MLLLKLGKRIRVASEFKGGLTLGGVGVRKDSI
mgnify:CR=1 FL=1